MIELFKTISIVYAVGFVLSLIQLWVFHQAYLAKKKWGDKTDLSDGLGIAALWFVTYPLVGISILYNGFLKGWNKNVLFKAPKPPCERRVGKRITNVG